MMKKPFLERLVINVSHDCNLRCRYCYAGTGSYGGQRSMLSETMGEKVIDDFFSRFERINTVQFFGGEPLLNYRVIAKICEYTSRVCEKRAVQRPAFTLVTNGTIINKAIIQIIRDYRVRTTVSLDGPQSINDSLRIYPNQSGSFNRIMANIRLLKERTGQPYQVEGTFTFQHLKQDFSMTEFMALLTRELDIHFLHIPWILGTSYNGHGIPPNKKNIDSLVAIYAEAITGSLQSLTGPHIQETSLISFVERFLSQYISAKTKRSHYCPAGSGTLSVSVDGNIYPCFMFTNNKAFELGRVGKTNHKELVQNRMKFAAQLEIPAKKTAGDNEVIMSCAGVNHEVHGRINRISTPEQKILNRLNAHLKNEVDRYKREPDKWEWMQAKYTIQKMEALGG